MQNGASLSRSILVAGLITGILADVLLRATPWGLNLLLWVCAPVASTLVLAHRDRSVRESYLIRLGAGAAAFAAGFAWRDSSVLVGLDIIALLALFSLGSLRTALRSVRSASLWEYTTASFTSGFASAFGMFPLLISDIKWKPNASVFRSKPVMAIGRGVLLALPLILVFGWLFAGADPVFGNLVGKAFNINMDFPDLMVQLLIITACCWFASGYMRRVLANVEVPAQEEPGGTRPDFGVVEISVALGLVNLLFLAFVVVQFKYFFGGGERVQTVAGLTYSEYARRGFFELVAVAALALPVLRGRRDRFAFGSMIAGFAIIGVLHVANPDAMIVRTNAARAACGRTFDVAYNTSLSADSVPELVKDIGLLRSEDQARVARSLLDHWISPTGDWRTWNSDRAAAVHAVQRAQPVLERYAASTYTEPVSASVR